MKITSNDSFRKYFNHNRRSQSKYLLFLSPVWWKCITPYIFWGAHFKHGFLYDFESIPDNLSIGTKKNSIFPKIFFVAMETNYVISRDAENGNHVTPVIFQIPIIQGTHINKKFACNTSVHTKPSFET